MSTAVLESLEDIDLTEGNAFSMDLIAHNGKLVVQRITPLPVPGAERASAVDEFLNLCASFNPGPLTGATDAELDEILLQQLTGKHLK